MRTLHREKLPGHLAIIMDGNGRWAKERMLRRIVGHQKGVETVRTIVEECSRLGIRYLTLFAFSSENWLRPKTEVRALMSLLKRYVRMEALRMMQNNIRFNIIGNRADLPLDVNREVDDAIAKTAGNTGMTLTLALSYGGRQEIIRAATLLAADLTEGRISAEAVDEASFERYLYSFGMPEPDLLIRTSGEMRISNFLLWQIAYAEIWVTDTLWPDFRRRHLLEAIVAYQKRERRYGGIKPARVATL